MIGLAKVGHEAHQAAPRLHLCKRTAKDITAMRRGAGNPRAASGAAHFDALLAFHVKFVCVSGVVDAKCVCVCGVDGVQMNVCVRRVRVRVREWLCVVCVCARAHACVRACVCVCVCV